MRSEQRWSQRKPVNIAARIQFGNEPPTRSCAIVNISDEGACLAVDAAPETPDKFILTLSPRGFPYRRCKVVWRSASEVGVKFDRNPLEDPRHVRAAAA
jgi:PilZ domain-containing protein